MRGDSQKRFKAMPEVIPTPGDTALVIIDMQYVDAHPDYGLVKKAKEAGNFAIMEYLLGRLPMVIRNIQRMQKVCRAKKIEVIFVKIQSYTQDGRDFSPSYRIKGITCPPGSKEAEILEELKPVGDEIVLNKLSTSAFTSTAIDQVLRYMGIKKLMVSGVNTNYCIETFIRDAYDRGYEVVLLEDCCATVEEKFHRMACEEMEDIFCKVRSTDQMVTAIQKNR
ncbi:MAG: cysteine hydrolase [Deltaproteobacteria bacterium]|nr:cysteine hydrolase [Deltaproteobacteria bacterium]